MKVEPRIVKQNKCQHCGSCKNYWGKGMEGGKKVSLCHYLADHKIMSLWGKKKCFGASYSTSNKLLLVATFWLWTSKNIFKVGSVKFANSLSLPSIVKKVLEVKATRQKSSELTTPPESPNSRHTGLKNVYHDHWRSKHAYLTCMQIFWEIPFIKPQNKN